VFQCPLSALTCAGPRGQRLAFESQPPGAALYGPKDLVIFDHPYNAYCLSRYLWFRPRVMAVLAVGGGNRFGPAPGPCVAWGV
jgi:hypothetical protein